MGQQIETVGNWTKLRQKKYFLFFYKISFIEVKNNGS